MLTKIHPDGPAFSRLILGAWRWADRNFSLVEREKLVETSIDLGISTIDHADLYGNYQCEALFGELISNRPSLRQQVQLVTKCGIKPISDKFPDRQLPTYDTSKEHILRSVDNSLKNIATDYIDLLLIHRPNPLLDPDIVAEAFSELHQSGKVLHFGVSNFTNEQFSLLQSRMDLPLVTNQVELSLTYTDLIFDGSLDYLYEKNVGPMIWSPLGGGDIFSNTELMDNLQPLAAKYEVDLATLMILWILKHPANNFPVLGTTRADRLSSMAKAMGMEMEREDWFSMLKHSRGIDVP